MSSERASDELVREIRERYAASEDVTHAELAQEYGVTRSAVQQWVRGSFRMSAGGPISRPGSNGRRRGGDVTRDYIVVASGCWLWQGYVDARGYGRVDLAGVKWFAHRLAWTVANGEILNGLTVDHICFETRCINPSHLQLLTNAANAARTRRALASACKRGHEYRPETMRRDKSTGRRVCLVCTRSRQNARSARLRAAMPT